MTQKGFIEHNSYRIVNQEDDGAELIADLKEQSLNPLGYVHGGFLFGLGDTAMGIVAYSNDRFAVTQNANITYLRPAKGKYITAKAKMIKGGKKVCFLNCDLYDDDNNLVATMSGSYYYIDKEN